MKKILIINDSKFESLVMKDMLNSNGHEVSIGTEFNALEKVKDFRPEYVILNYEMKEIKGDKLAQIIKEQDSNIKCILNSNSPININDFNEKKVTAVFQTPVSSEKLDEIINKIN